LLDLFLSSAVQNVQCITNKGTFVTKYESEKNADTKSCRKVEVGFYPRWRYRRSFVPLQGEAVKNTADSKEKYV